MQFVNEISPEYENTRDSLSGTFPEAYEFLTWIENLADKGFHMGTAINLHLYHNDKFLFYFRKDSATQVTISSKEHINIKQGTHVDNKSLFLLWFDLLKKMNLEKSRGIKINKKNDFVVTITKSIDYPKLFDALKKAIILFSHQK